MAVCCSCPCCETIRGHFGMLKSPCVTPAEHRDISVCRTMTILSLLSQGISYPKAAKVTPCKCNTLLGAVSIHYCSFLHSGHATSFLRLYRISSHLHIPTSSSACFYGACYTASFSHDHHPAPAFTAPAINHIIHSPSASFTAPAVSSP